MLNLDDLMLDYQVLRREHIRSRLGYRGRNLSLDQKDRQPKLIHKIIKRLTFPS